MTLIKKIIAWIISLFHKDAKNKKHVNYSISQEVNLNKTNSKKIHNGVFNGELPPYFMINNQDKELLIKNIQNLRETLINNSAKERIIQRITELLNNSLVLEDLDKVKKQLNNQDFDKTSVKRISDLLNDLNIEKEKIKAITDTIIKENEFVKASTSNLDNLIRYIGENDISIGVRDTINDKILIPDNALDSKVITNKDILNIIKDWDKSIIEEVMLEYEKANYVTISTILVDKIIEKYNSLEEDYGHHRYNKFYYDRQLNKLKKQVDYLQNLKNNPDIEIEIQKLRKELYSKSKDKYDLLYNNEIFMNIHKKCDELLLSINQRVVDIKKDHHDEDNKEDQKQEYLKKIILRFQDLDLAKTLIVTYSNQNKDIDDIILSIDMAYSEFLKTLTEPFNFQRNKAKTELVKLYNDLNRIISSFKREPYILVEHINFKMEDLINAVIVRKNELSRMFPLEKELSNSQLVVEKIEKMKKKYLETKGKKLIKKTYNS